MSHYSEATRQQLILFLPWTFSQRQRVEGEAAARLHQRAPLISVAHTSPRVGRDENRDTTRLHVCAAVGKSNSQSGLQRRGWERRGEERKVSEGHCHWCLIRLTSPMCQHSRAVCVRKAGGGLCLLGFGCVPQSSSVFKIVYLRHRVCTPALHSSIRSLWGSRCYYVLVACVCVRFLLFWTCFFFLFFLINLVCLDWLCWTAASIT